MSEFNDEAILGYVEGLRLAPHNQFYSGLQTTEIIQKKKKKPNQLIEEPSDPASDPSIYDEAGGEKTKDKPSDPFVASVQHNDSWPDDIFAMDLSSDLQDSPSNYLMYDTDFTQNNIDEERADLTELLNVQFMPTSEEISTSNAILPSQTQSSTSISPLQGNTFAVIEDQPATVAEIISMVTHNEEMNEERMETPQIQFASTSGATNAGESYFPSEPINTILLVNGNEEYFVIPKTVMDQYGSNVSEQKKSLQSYCWIHNLQKSFTSMLALFKAEPVPNEKVMEFLKSEMEKMQKWETYLQTEGLDNNNRPAVPASPIAPASPENPDSDVIVEGLPISRSAWASAYAHTDIKNSAVEIFEEVYTEEEKNTCTLSGRICIDKNDGSKVKTQRLDPRKLNVINHSIASIQQRKHTYYYCSNDYKTLKKADFNLIKNGISQRLNQIKQAKKKLMKQAIVQEIISPDSQSIT